MLQDRMIAADARQALFSTAEHLIMNVNNVGERYRPVSGTGVDCFSGVGWFVAWIRDFS